MTDQKSKPLTQAEIDKAWASATEDMQADGMREVGQRAPFHDFDTTPLLKGKVVGIEHAVIKGEERQFMEVETKDGPVSIGNNAMLQRLFDQVKPGQRIAVLFTGTKPLPGKKTLREFKVAIAGVPLEE